MQPLGDDACRISGAAQRTGVDGVDGKARERLGDSRALATAQGRERAVQLSLNAPGGVEFSFRHAECNRESYTLTR